MFLIYVLYTQSCYSFTGGTYLDECIEGELLSVLTPEDKNGICFHNLLGENPGFYFTLEFKNITVGTKFIQK